jgi:general secretion pathway protein D
VARAALLLGFPVSELDGRALAAGDGPQLPAQKDFNRCLPLPRRRSKLKFNLPPNAELHSLVAWMSGIGCAQVIFPPALLKGKKVTIFAPRNISFEEAYRLFYGALESHGLTVEPQGRFLRIVEIARARFMGLPVVIDDRPADTADNRHVTRLFRFEYLDPAAVLAQLYNHLRGEKGVGAVSGGSLVVTDQGAMLERFAQIVRELDKPELAKERLWMVRVKSSSARAMAHRLAEIFDIRQLAGRPAHRPAPGPSPPAARATPRQGGRPLRAAPRVTRPLTEMLTIAKMIPDERTNQLIVVAQEAAHDLLLTILERLDAAPDEADHGMVHVYSCEHADCDELAVTLGAITGLPLMAAGAPRARPGSARPRGPVRPAMTPARTVSGSPGPAAELFEREVRITVDLGTNSLIVVSSHSDFAALRRLVAKLDVPRKQVYVEAVILEVLLDKSRDLGVAYHAGRTLDAGGAESLVLGGFDPARTLNPGGLAGDLVGLAARCSDRRSRPAPRGSSE